MKSLLRNTLMYAVSLYILMHFITGLRIEGGIATLLYGGFILTILILIVKPIINLISFPLNAVTLGLFSTFTNVIILYLLTVFVTNIVISPFTTERVSFAGFIIPSVALNLFFAYVFVALLLFFLTSVLSWIIK